MNTKSLLQEAEKLKNCLIEIRRDFHRNPELAMEEFRTRDKILSYLQEMKIETITGIARTGVVGIIRGRYSGKTVALRADMDALPMQDWKEVSYKSLAEGKMHACGHDAHMTILLGAAKILKKMENQINGTIKLIFQPAEETVGGAKYMIDAGVMENPRVDAIFGLHVTTQIETGKIGIKYGHMKATSDTIKIRIFGESTHGAYPHEGVDPVVISGQIITGLQSIVSRNIDPRHAAVVSIGTIHGGTRGNIVANKVEMLGTVRTLDPDIRKKVLARIVDIVENSAKALGGRGEVILEEGYPALINHNSFVDIVADSGQELLGQKNVIEMKTASLGVEDFGFYLQEIPGAFYNLGCRNEKKDAIHPGHSNYFDIDEECLPIGVALQVKNALKVLED